ncbi:MAG: heparin lyase I family protein, partial [Solirubrobacterales bacterium]
YPITPTENPRAQVMSPPKIEPGDEIWWHSSFYLPANFPSSVPGWLNLLEGPYGGPFNGSPPWQIQVVGNSIQWTRNKTYSWDVPWKMPLVKEKWVDVVVHERFGSSGFVEMWVDGQPVTFFSGGTNNPLHVAPTTHLNMATMDSSNNGGANSIILQSYRKAGMFSSVTVFEGPLTVGKSQASVVG